jgi:predicted ribosomally synthesized peptide with nif11-like leader
MYLSETTLQSLRQLLEQDAALRERLQRARNTAEAAQTLVPAAKQAGLEVCEEDLRNFFASQIPGTADQVLNDEQLDKVAGGMSYIERQAASFFSFGLACLSPNPGNGQGAPRPVGRPL